jgi:hypothetical protein
MRRTMIVALAMLTLPGLAAAQGGPPRGGMGSMMQQNVAQLLLDRRADLVLETEQITSLERIAKQLQEKAEPVMKEMEALRGSGGMRNMPADQRQAMMAKMQGLRAANDEAFEKEIKPLLNAAQAEQAAKMIAEARPPRRGEGARARSGR